MFHSASRREITCLWDENPSQLYFYTLKPHKADPIYHLNHLSENPAQQRKLLIDVPPALWPCFVKWFVG